MMMLQSEEQAGADGEGRSTTLETSFERVVCRVATDAERTRLYRIRDALGLRDNDAFWSIVMALEYYDPLFPSGARRRSVRLAHRFGSVGESVRADRWRVHGRKLHIGSRGLRVSVANQIRGNMATRSE